MFRGLRSWAHQIVSTSSSDAQVDEVTAADLQKEFEKEQIKKMSES